MTVFDRIINRVVYPGSIIYRVNRADWLNKIIDGTLVLSFSFIGFCVLWLCCAACYIYDYLPLQ